TTRLINSRCCSVKFGSRMASSSAQTTAASQPDVGERSASSSSLVGACMGGLRDLDRRLAGEDCDAASMPSYKTPSRLRFLRHLRRLETPLFSLEWRGMRALAWVPVCLLLLGCQVRSQKTSDFDLIICHGTVYDGSGDAPRQADVGVRGQRIASVGDLSRSRAALDVDAKGLAVAPGFVNVLSWAPD